METYKILEAVVGSKAYGLDTELSDTDTLGVFVAPTVEVAGLSWSQSDESWSDAGPDGDDHTLHEVGKFLRLLLKQNPTMLELLFMDEYLVLTDTGRGVIDLRDRMLYTDGVRSVYSAYAKSQLERVKRDYPNHKPKMLRHALRLARQGSHLLEFGQFSPRVSDPEEFFRLDSTPLDEADRIVTKEIERLERVASALRESADIDAVKGFLTEVRRDYLG